MSTLVQISKLSIICFVYNKTWYLSLYSCPKLSCDFDDIIEAFCFGKSFFKKQKEVGVPSFLSQRRGRQVINHFVACKCAQKKTAFIICELHAKGYNTFVHRY